MLCRDASLRKNITVSETESVEKAAAFLMENNLEALCVVDDEMKPLGIFSIPVLLKNLLPVSVAMNDGSNIEIQMSAAPGILKRLKNVALLPVFDLMERRIIAVPEGAPVWEGLKLVLQHHMPLIVLDAEGRVTGQITPGSVYEALSRVKEE